MYFFKKLWVKTSVFESDLKTLLFSKTLSSCFWCSTGWIMKSSSSWNWLKIYVVVGASLWFLQTLSATLLSFYAFFSSRMIKIKSKRERRESCIPIFFVGGLSVWYSPKIGFAAAITAHLAFKEQWIPAFAIVTVCCSMTSWTATLSLSFILSN